MRAIVDEALKILSPAFEGLYAPIGRHSIAPEKLLRALLLQAFYSVRSERQLMEQLDYNLLFRWFVGLAMDAPIWDVTVLTKKRERLLEGEVAAKFMAAVLGQPRIEALLSDEHFSVDGTFHDGPADLFERMRLNVALNEELGVRIWSFPMRYQPTDRPDRGHIGKKWSRYQLRSMQIILQATHGIVSGEPAFFKRAFGDTFEEFERILLLPHDFIFNRDWYERFDKEQRLEEYQAEFARLDAAERAELVDLLSSCDPRAFAKLGERTGVPAALKRVLPFYIPTPKTSCLPSGRARKLCRAARPNSGWRTTNASKTLGWTTTIHRPS